MTLQEVARRAGVSTATVSRVLNHPAVVREETRNRVLRAAEALEYRPNRYAQSLAGGRTPTLGVIVSNIENPFFLDILHTIEERAIEAGYEVVYENTGYRVRRLAAAVDVMLTRPLAGLAMITSEHEQRLVERVLDWGRAAVFFDAGGAASGAAQVRLRYEKGMRRTVEYLYSLGHRRMAFVGHHGVLEPLRQRECAFLRTVQRFADVEHLTMAGEDGPAGGRKCIQQMRESGFKPTAVLCVNDFMAIGVLRELRDAGFRVPQDVSVTGFDNIELSEYLYPALTTVNIPRRRIGSWIFEILTAEPGLTQALDQSLLIEPELLVRESTAAASSMAEVARAAAR